MEPGTLEHIHSLYVPPLFEDVLFLVLAVTAKAMIRFDLRCRCRTFHFQLE
jgi:hypothetical protein